MKVSTTNLKIEFISGHIIKFDKTNLSVQEPHKIIEKLKKTRKKLLNFLIKKLYSNKEKDSIYRDVIVDISNNKIFSDEDKDYIKTTINKIENKTEFDYYEINYKTKNDDDYEL